MKNPMHDPTRVGNSLPAFPWPKKIAGDFMVFVTRWITVLALVAFLTPASPVWSQDYSMYFDTSETAPSGSSIQIRCMLDNPGGDIAGWSFAVCEETVNNDYDFTAAVSGEAAMTANGGSPAAFDEITVCPGEGVIQGVVVDFVGINSLPAASGYEMIVIDVTLLGPDDTFTTVEYCNAILCTGGSAPTETLVVPPGGSAPIIPEQVPGTIEIGGLPPFGLDASFATASADQGTTVDAEITVNAPLEYYGISLGLAHDASKLDLIAAEPGTTLQSLNGGAGPDFLLIDLEPVGAAGLVVAAVGSTEPGTPEALPAGTSEQLITAQYEIAQNAALGLTSLQFSNELIPAPGSPATETLISLGNQAAILTTSTSNLEITEAPLGTAFKRGDFDANGNVNLADPINILNYQFSGGAAPTCLKIMDIDDSGNIQLNDPVLLLTYLFSGGAAPSEPFDSCGIDPTEDTITCDSFDACP
jgi:hypothetical protein